MTAWIATFLTEPSPDFAPIPVAPGERWCRNCGASIPAESTSKEERPARCCARPYLVPVVKFLRPDEYYIRL